MQIPPNAIKDEESKEGAGGLETQKIQGAGKKGNKVTFVFPLRAFEAQGPKAQVKVGFKCILTKQ